MKKIEKLLSLMLAVLLIVSFTACENRKQEITERKAAVTEELKAVKDFVSVDASYAHKYDLTLEEALEIAHTVIYGEVISRGKTELFEYYRGAENMNIGTYCVTDVNIKVLDCIKGDAKGEIVYKEASGTVDGVHYFTQFLDSPVEGEKVLLFLSENGALIGVDTKGYHIEDANGKFTVDISFLKEDMYESGKAANAKIGADEYIKYLKQTLKNISLSQETEKGGSILIADGANMYDIYSIANIEMMAEDIVYGKVISKSEPKVFDMTLLNVNDYCYCEVEIEVISRARGDETKKTVTYLEAGGTVNGVEYKTENIPKTKIGDNVLLLLTKNGTAAFGENNGIFIADENGYITVNNFLEGGGMEGKIKAENYIDFLKNEIEKYEKAEDERLKELFKSSPSGKMESHVACTLTDPDYDYYDMLEDTDLIVYGTVKFGDKDIMVSGETYPQEGDSCFTQVFLEVEKCIYSEDAYTDIDEVMYLKWGGETETTIYYDNSDPEVSEGEKILIYLQDRGAYYYCNEVIRVNDKGELIVNRDQFPERYSDAYSNTMTVDEYGKALNEAMSYIK